MLERAIPLYGGVAIVAAILFGPTGVDPRDIAGRMAGSTALRCVVWAAWLLMSAPVVGPLLRDRRGDFLRGLPISKRAQFAAFAMWSVASQLPMVALVGAGAGGLAALRAALLGATAAVLLAATSRRPTEIAALVGVLIALGIDASGWSVLALAPAALLAAHGVWERAPEVATSSAGLVRGPAPVALGIAHALRILRIEQAAMLRALGWAFGGGAVVAIAARNSDRLGADTFVLAGLAIPIILASSAVAKPLRESDRTLDVVLRSAGATDREREVALGGAIALFGIAVGLLAFAGARIVAPLPIPIVFAAPALGAVLSPWVVALQSVPDANGRTRRDAGGRTLLALFALGALAIVMASMIGDAAVLVLGGASVAAWLVRQLRHRPPTSSADPGSSVLEARAVSKRFGANTVLRSASIAVAGGSISLVRGENGSGKSTLLKIAAGVIEADEGEVRIDGRRLAHDRHALRAIGYAPDVAELPEHLSAGELVALVAAIKRAPFASTREDNARLGIGPLLGQRMAALSLGQRRRVGLATALVGAPKVLLLDEPTNGLDAAGLDVLETILRERRARGGAALLASHDPGFGDRLADEVHWIREGRVVVSPA